MGTSADLTSTPLAGHAATAQHGVSSVEPTAPAAAISAQPLTERAKLEAMMADRTSSYWTGSDAERNQARYRALVEGAPEQAQSQSESTTVLPTYAYDFSKFSPGEHESAEFSFIGDYIRQNGGDQSKAEL